MQASSPIGIFDSGVGGLAVARVIKDLLPNESIYYVGDTARLPYGEKTIGALQRYTQVIGNFLLSKGCKLILIACNTATAAAANLLQEQVGSQVPVFNVIDPVVTYVKQHYPGKNMGLIGTHFTVQSQVYPQKLQALQTNVLLKMLPTPLLAPMIEAGQYQSEIVETYLSNPQLVDIHALILGCTHYWLIKQEISHYYQKKIEIIDGASLLATSIQDLLHTQQLSNPKPMPIEDQFVVTKLTPASQTITQRLFGKNVRLINLPELDS